MDNDLDLIDQLNEMSGHLREASSIIRMQTARIKELENAMNKWQPIETAPKDGTPIFVYANCVGWEYFVVKWIDTMWYTLDSDYNPFFPGLSQPTYWMPLYPPEEFTDD